MMKKNFILPLLAAAATLTGVAQGADPVATWTESGTWGGADKNMTVSDDGNWTMKITLDPEALYNEFKPDPEPDFVPSFAGDTNVYHIDDTTAWKHSISGNYIASDTTGVGLFNITGSGWNNAKNNNEGSYYEGHKTTFVMGWGNDWYKSISNGVEQGLQLGFSDRDAKTVDYNGETAYVNFQDRDLEGSRTGWGLQEINSFTGLFNNFDVYRADTKLQTGDGWTIEEGAGLSTVDTLDAIVTGAEISTADLTIVHHTAGDIKTSNSSTALYLTIVLKDGTTLRYMAEIDDVSTFSQAGTGTLIGGSAGYDVDNFTLGNIDGLEDSGLIQQVEIYGNAHYVNSDGTLGAVIPEPASATLSMMALSALCARRRRRK